MQTAKTNRVLDAPEEMDRINMSHITVVYSVTAPRPQVLFPVGC